MANQNYYDFNVEVRPTPIGTGLDGWYQIVRCTRDARQPVTAWQRAPQTRSNSVHESLRNAANWAKAQIPHQFAS
ncbi:hypothetical protein [Jeongeupia naejangsanensis]|uniref:Uncharacterized protein n=1 Tax=Jeongeupia naejangsanensis TaxID=613195 RepID=A0ABS2BKE2_9NEIS|nr:hypothetical protein [Jeongeupia naejangsanensis]MBM3115538.1 hypothetical protein [Jeongeupia naejangsanensis]